MYRRGDKYKTKSGRTYFFISHPGIPEGKFTKVDFEDYWSKMSILKTNL